MLWKFIRWLLLVKEIVSKEGRVHFRRYRLFACPWLRVYLHHILMSDMDKHKHDHPWHFCSLILRGAYKEIATYSPYHFAEHTLTYRAGSLILHQADDAHQITLLTPSVWSLVVAWGKSRDWGYRCSPSIWIPHQEYRRIKNEGELT